VIDRLIRSAFARPALVILLALAGAGLGVVAVQDLPRDVFPDLSTPVFNIIVQNSAMSAEELETSIAIPLETALAGLPNVRRVRSSNQLGVAQVTVEFESDADYYRARQFVAERVAQIGPQLPPGTDAPLLSSLTGRLNEIFEFTLEADPGAATLMTLRDLAEFDVRNRLLAVPGVAAVERLGGYLREFQVQMDPERMSARGITLDELLHFLPQFLANASHVYTSCLLRARRHGTHVPCARGATLKPPETICNSILSLSLVRLSLSLVRKTALRRAGPTAAH